MRKLSLAVSVAALSVVPSLSLADIFDARSMGRGGAGLTMGEYNQAILNPALINHFDENDDFSFALNAGVFASDKDDMLQATEDAQDAIDDLENGIGDAGDVDAQLLDLSGKIVQADVGSSVLLGIPNKSLPMAVVVRGKVAFGTVFDYSNSDSAILQDIDGVASDPLYVPNPANDTNGDGQITQDDLTSTITASAIAVTEGGFMFGHKMNGLELGATLKAQQIELISYTANVANFDEGDISDSDLSEKSSSVNVDLGANLRLGENGQFVVAGTIENLVPQTFDGPLGTEYEMEPVVTAAVGYGSTYFKAEANMDLTVRNGYDLLADTQFARVGLEFSAGRHFHLRAGYRADLKDNVSDVITGGIGITPFDRFNIDLSGMIGEGETYGAALQIGFKI
jgi:hypothetical protein